MTDEIEFNLDLLKEQISDLKTKLEKAESVVEKSETYKHELDYVQKRNEQWQAMCAKFLSLEEVESLGGQEALSPRILDKKMAELQRDSCLLNEELDQAKSR